MWRQCIILCLSFVSCFAIPRSSGKRELQRLVRLPRIEFASPLVFDRTSGFVIFPNEVAAATEAAEALKGKAITQATAEEAAKAALSKAKSLGHNSAKIHLARVAVKRAILTAAGAEGGAA